MHNFYVPKPTMSAEEEKGQMKHNPDKSSSASSSSSSAPNTTPTQNQNPEGDDPRPEPMPFTSLHHFRVFGMTARILVDAARVAYGEEPEFEHNSHHGDEEMIGRLLRVGRMSEVRRKGEEPLTNEVLKQAVKETGRERSKI
jgi:hypothetical protein